MVRKHMKLVVLLSMLFLGSVFVLRAEDSVITAAPEDTGPPFVEEIYDAIATEEAERIAEDEDLQEQIINLPPETDPTVDESVKDGVDWTELSGIPAGFADGIDDVSSGGGLWSLIDANIYYIDGSVGIGTTEPNARLDVETVDGEGGAATIGSGLNSAIGDYAVAMGDSTTANGKASIATGTGTIAIGDYSTAMGYYTDAIGDYSTAMGTSTTASGYRSTSMGDITTASGDYSTAMGYKTTASGYRSTAMGCDTTASGYFSNAMGYGTIASNYFSTAMGRLTTASEFYSTAMGTFTAASGEASTAMGCDTTASGTASTATGYRTIASGNHSTAMGHDIEAAGESSFAIGLNVTIDNVVTQDNTMSIMGGRVGIGTTAPSRTFFVYGDAGGTMGWFNDSDSRLKKDIATIDNALEKVNKLRGVEFEWKNPENHVEGRQIGFIGQETVEVVPEVVDIKDGWYSMQYASLTALLVEAVKELQSENDELQEQNNRLESRLSALENAMKSGASIEKEL